MAIAPAPTPTITIIVPACIEANCINPRLSHQTRCKQHHFQHQLATKGPCTRCGNQPQWAKGLCTRCQKAIYREEEILRIYEGSPLNRDAFKRMVDWIITDLIRCRAVLAHYINTGAGSRHEHTIVGLRLLDYIQTALTEGQRDYILRAVNRGAPPGERLHRFRKQETA